jgi:predicted NUDIX family NTP pyrophosphohydrolase
MPARSAGVLLWRRTADGTVQVLIGHMGGPFWARKDAGAWSVPKGEYGASDPAKGAALREFSEELGVALPIDAAVLVELGEIRQASGKRLTIWAGEADLDPDTVVPGTFTMQWPPRSGREREFPELDRVEWSSLPLARERLVTGQRAFLDRLLASLG